MTDPGEQHPVSGPGAGGGHDDAPLGIHLLIWLGWFLAGAVVLALLTLIFGQGPVPMGGETVTRPEALTRLLPVLVPLGLAVLGAALALQLRAPWARPAVLLPLALALFGPAFTGVGTVRDMAFGALFFVPLLALLGWYLYRAKGVVRYFQGLRESPGD